MTDHHHPDLWSKRDHERFEDRLAGEIRDLRTDVDDIASRLAWIIGGVGVAVFVLTMIAPILQKALGLQT